VDTGGTIPDTQAQIDAVVAQLKMRPLPTDGGAFRRYWS
jgi:hypothetical protein